jgi:glycosyltransferase involved in cell wall biosynthesis
MIAYHFPPLAGSSGIQRTLRFVQHLPSHGWEAVVLTAHPRAYERTSDDLMAEIPRETFVKRAFALDAARHFAVAGRYPSFLASPDRWSVWRLGAIAAGKALIREYRPDILWSTYPIATAHAIGASLHRASGVPWVADFRDPMAQVGYPANPRIHEDFRRIEAVAIDEARLSVFTTPGAARAYRERYPTRGARIRVLENGYDEESFAGLSRRTGDQPLTQGAITVLHSGIVYPSERDPTCLFEALARLVAAGALAPGRFKLRFRAAGHEELLHALTRRHGLAGFIEILPSLPYREALAEMVRADGLLVLQASNCNEQIPAKIYEYLRAGRPILALTDPAGDTAQALREAGLRSIAALDSIDDIVSAMSEFVAGVRADRAPLPNPAHVARLSRAQQTRALAAWFDEVAAREDGADS